MLSLLEILTAVTRVYLDIVFDEKEKRRNKELYENG